MPYRSWFYGHVALLHTSLLLRVVGGDLIGNGAFQGDQGAKEAEQLRAHDTPPVARSASGRGVRIVDTARRTARVPSMTAHRN